MAAFLDAVTAMHASRSSGNLWRKLLEPLQSMVPCEDVKVVVRSIGAPPQDPPQQGPFARSVRLHTRGREVVKYVERWNPRRIEGQAALTQRILCIPSSEAERQQWHQYEDGRPSAGDGSFLRCLAALPLVDAAGVVLAVVKLVNRRSLPDSQPRLEFSPSDLATLTAWGRLFACVFPQPYLGLPGSGLLRRPQPTVALSERGVAVAVSWQLPKELAGNLVHEIRYRSISHEDEFDHEVPQEEWTVVPCGILEPVSKPEESELCYAFEVPKLEPYLAYTFSVRARNMHMALEWSEPSVKLSTFLAPPHPAGSETVLLSPLSESAVQLQWAPFQSCDPCLRSVEYRVVAHCPSESEGKTEQVVAVLISDGTAVQESVVVTNLRSNVVYTFALEARYPHVGMRTFTPALMSDELHFPEVDVKLPAPQPLADAGQACDGRDASPPSATTVWWPYSPDLAPRLALQRRTASVHGEGGVRLHLSSWDPVEPGDISAPDACGDGRRLLRHAPAQEGQLAVQLRVLTPSSPHRSSPLSTWFHAGPLRPPGDLGLRLVCSDADGMALRVAWTAQSSNLLDSDSASVSCHELGPLSCAVYHDLSRGYGPCATRFQLRLRLAPWGGGAPAEWADLAPQSLPPAVGESGDGPAGPARPGPFQVSSYEWMLQDQRWFLQPGVMVEAQLRHGNALLWSAWTEAGAVSLQVQPPRPMIGDILQCEDVQPDSARLLWFPFISGEAGLQTLEYRILRLELLDGQDDTCSDVDDGQKWQTVDSFVVGGERMRSSNADATTPLHFVMKSLAPHRSYHFAVECRYGGLPSILGAQAASYLQTVEPVTCPDLCFSCLPGDISAKTSLVCPAGWQAEGFSLRLQWRSQIHPKGAMVPLALCYQISGVPDLHEDPGLRSQTMLPPMLLPRSAHGDGDGYVPARFAVDDSREVASAEVELNAAFLKALTALTGPRLRLAVRVGCPSTGTWGVWSEPSNAVDVALVPPGPADGDTLSVAEQLWSSPALASMPHAAEAVTLAWRPFRRSPETPEDRHAQLAIQYEIIVWAVDPAAGSSDELRDALCMRAAVPREARVAFKHTLCSAHVGAAIDSQHQLQVPGDCLQAGEHHFVQVVGRYMFSGGTLVPEASLPAPRAATGAALVSEQAYQPTPSSAFAPCLEAFDPPYDEIPGGCALLSLPEREAAAGAVAADSLAVELREGQASPTADGPAVAATGEWSLCENRSVQVLPGAKSRILVKDVPARICQFRFRLGEGVASEPSAWTDAVVWRPRGEAHALSDGPGDLQRLEGLAVTLGINHQSLLYVRLAWPRRPPASEEGVVALQKYQVRYHGGGEDDWQVLPLADLPHTDVAVAECHVTGLECGCRYEFSIRLCNALGRWSEWSPPTKPLTMQLPTLVPRHGIPHSGLQIAMASPTAMRLRWQPFCVSCFTPDSAEPLIVFDGDDVVTADYRVIARTTDGKIVATLHHDGPAFVHGPPADGEDVWVDMDMLLEPHLHCSFEIQACLPRTQRWGPPVRSPPLPPRLHPIAVDAPAAELLRSGHGDAEEGRSPFGPSVRIRCAVHGFEEESAHGARPDGAEPDSDPAADATLGREDLAAAALARYQVRSSPIDAASGGPGSWAEWPAADSSSAPGTCQDMLQFDLQFAAAAVPPPPGDRYVFSVRCADEYGRWTPWSPPSGAVSLRAPSLAPAGLGGGAAGAPECPWGP